MSWSTRFRLRQYLKGSLWVIPFVGGIMGAILGFFEPRLDHAVSVPESWQYSPSTASTLLATIIGAMAALTGFVVTVSVLVVQMAIGTFSARYMRLWYRDRMLKGLLALLVATLTFSFALLRQIGPDFVPTIGVTVAGLLMLVGLLFFMVFLDRFLHRLRPVAVAALMARAGLRAFETVTAPLGSSEDLPKPVDRPSILLRSERAGAIQAVDIKGILEWAAAHDRVLYAHHIVGDFVPSGAVLLEVVGASADPEGDRRRLRGMFALGDERTIEQDPAFAIRIMVDVAIKALSSAINDPTTATQVLNHLTELLRQIGSTPLAGRTRFIRDEAGSVRVVSPVRCWEDFLALAVTEIREYGADSIQVLRRLRSTLEELHETVLPEHQADVEGELARLDATLELRFGNSVDLDRAGVSDRQGIGGQASAAFARVREQSLG
jgi:uncharacterized membrane protein